MKRLLAVICIIFFFATSAFAEVRQRGATTKASGCTTCTVNKPTGTVNGDLMLTWIFINPNTATVTPPAGWSQVCTENAGIFLNRLYQKTASSQAASETWTVSNSGAIYQMALFDPTGGSLVEDGTQAACTHVATSGSLSITPSALTASTTWEAGIAFMVENQAAVQVITTPKFYNTLLQELQASPTEQAFVNQPASGTVTYPAFTSTASDSGSGWDYATILVKGANAPTKDFRLRDATVNSASAASSITCNAPAGIVNGDLLVLCASFDTTTALTCPAGFTNVGHDETTRAIAACTKIAASESGNYSISGGAGSNTNCVAQDFFDNNGQPLFASSATEATGASAASFTGSNITPAAANDILNICYFAGVGSSHHLNNPGQWFAGQINQPGATGYLTSTGSEFAPSTSAVTPPTVQTFDSTAAVWKSITLDIAPSPTATPTATPTPAGQCTPNAAVRLLNSSKKVMNGTASATNGTAHWDVLATDTSGFLVDSFTGTASGTTGVPRFTVRIVDNAGKVCSGTDSAVAGSSMRTYRVCNSSNQVAGCTESATSASYDYSVNIIDNNGKIDDAF